jgi:hypothetical protein
MAARHLRQTGRRESSKSGSPQMRQSEGNNTENRLVAVWRNQLEATEGLAIAELLWLARTLKLLLLKTALHAHTLPTWRVVRLGLDKV